MKQERNLVIVLARGHSTRVPGKNIRLVGGRPVLHYTFDHVRQMQQQSGLTKAVLTEDPQVAAICEEFTVCYEQLDIPGEFPARLEPAVQEVEAAIGSRFDHILVLNADCPRRPPALLDDCLTKLRTLHLDMVCSVIQVPLRFHPFRTYELSIYGAMHSICPSVVCDTLSQNYPPRYSLVGGCFAMRRCVLPQTIGVGFHHASFRRHVVVCQDCDILEIDTQADLDEFERQTDAGTS